MISVRSIGQAARDLKLVADDDRFREMFFEEARELLHSLEEGLMELERRQGDRAHLDKTFRAAHSIKGAAGMVGLAALAEFTHGIEGVLDRVRSGSLAVDSYLISTLLEARDHLAVAVEAEAVGSPIPAPTELVGRLSGLIHDRPRAGGPAAKTPPLAEPPPSIPTAPTGITIDLSEPDEAPPLTKEEAPSESKRKPRKRASRAKKAAPALAPPDSTSGGEEAAETGGANQYRITLIPGPDVLRRGVNPLGVLDELRELGPTRLTTDPDQVPPLDELDPERCYLAWTLELTTAVPLERLEDVFLFMSDDSQVAVEKRDSDGRFVTVREPDAHPPPVVEQAPSAFVAAAEATAPAAPQPLPAAPRPHPTAVAQAGSSAMSSTPARRPPARIRVDAVQLDDLVGLAGELAVLSDNLQGITALAGVGPWTSTLEALERVSRLIRDNTLELRMVPVEELFSRFPRVVRDLADRSGKEIELRIQGQETRLDRTIVERLSEPMIHLIRNAVDHGLETPAERLAAGKPRTGRITLWAGHEGDRVALRIEEDGRGLDRDRIVRKGIAAGLVPVGTSADDPRVDTLIFEPGFSTRDQVSELSGRGVGLDVVRDAVRGLRGSLAVESVPGNGTAFIFRLPLTLALIDGLLIEAAGNRYVVPLAQVEECVALNGTMPALSRGRPCVSVRGELVPMVPLRKLFHANGTPPARQELLLTRHSGQRVGVAVDRLLGRVQAVIQGLGEGLHGLGRFSGATILADGSVSLILDLAALVAESRANDNHNHGASTRS
jgi:two-component system chemotaxis sensor kinase CheA